MAELLGHHLMNGFATPKRPDRGIEWLDDAGTGARSWFQPARGERLAGACGAAPAGRRRTPGAAPEPMLQDAAAPQASQASRCRWSPQPRTEAR